MKKSKFLRSSKDLLSRSFNPSKCKTSLRLAASRLKLMRNKKEAEVKHTRREISLLLQSGQDQTARMRVEHVIRDEKLVVAFDLIEIYCELIVARLPIIESQKICPIDLKEAIASIVYASPRCSEIPELAELKKHFTDKYGKDFITAAAELRPDCGVSRMMIEKLSVVASDVETKTKILTAIADEYNVKWDAKPFEQNSVPANDRLSGPTTFVKETEPYDSQYPESKAPESDQSHYSASNFTHVSGFNTSFQHEVHPQGGERAHLFGGDINTIPHNRQRWNMEFKDATSAAQAAAESAEMASMAARAAAELSSRGRISRQTSAESHKSDDHSKDSRNRSLYEYSRSQNEQIDRRSLNNTGRRVEDGFDSRKEYSHSSSLESKASTDEDKYSQKGMQRQSFKNQAESRAKISENVREVVTGKQERFAHNGGEKSPLGFGKEGNGSAVVFDRSDSDTDDYGFDTSPTYDEPQQGLQLPLSSKKSREHLSTNTAYKESPQYDQTQLSLSSDYESEETDSERNRGKKIDADPPSKFNLEKSSRHQPTLVPNKNQMELNDSSPEREEGLNFGKLTGGFRHKGYNYPSLGKNQFDLLLSKKESKATTMLERKDTKPDLQSTSDTDSTEDDEEEEVSWKKSSDNRHKLYTPSGGKDIKTKPSFAASNSMFGSGNGDPPKDSLRRTNRLHSGISRRTKAFPSNREREEYSETKLRSEAPEPANGMHGKATTSTSSDAPKRYETTRNSSTLEAHDSHATIEQKTMKSYSAEPRQQFQSSEVATKPTYLNSRGYLHQHSSEKGDAPVVQESKLSAKSSAIEEASLPQRKTQPNPKTEMLNKDSNNQRLSHVHPKLPDYDSFVQFFQKSRS